MQFRILSRTCKGNRY